MPGPARSRRRTAMLAGLTALLTAAPLGLVAAGATAAPVHAAAAPALTVVGANRTITATWAAVAGASAYRVRWSARGEKTHAKQVAGTSLTLRKLPNRRNWTVRVTPVGVAAHTAHAAARTWDAYPYAVSDVQVQPAGANQVQVTWSGGGRATHVGVIAAADHDIRISRFHSHWYPATTHSILLTVPKRLRAQLGTGSGGYVFVRVVETNDEAKAPAFHWASDQRAFRRSTTAPSSMAGFGSLPATDQVDHLAVAELNTQTASASSGFAHVDQWDQRVGRVAATVLDADPAVLLTSELSTAKTSGGQQYTDLLRAVQAGEPTGQDYELATADAAAHVTATGETNITDGAQILYDASRLTLLDHGYISPEQDLKVPGWAAAGIPDRLLSWARFELPSGKQFVAVAVHFPAVASPAVGRLHAQEAQLLAGWISAHVDPSLPVIVGGDFNADPVYPSYAGPADSRVLVADGFTDAAATADRSGEQWATFNASNGTGGSDPGYPDTASPHPYPYTRIDFVLLRGAAYSYSWRNVLHVSGGRFDKAFQGTDHDLQLADIGIG